MPERLSAYDERVLEELLAWRSPPSTRKGRMADRLETGVERVMRFVPTRLVERVLEWLMPRMRDLTWRATSRDLVLRAYRRRGTAIDSIDEIATLDLETVDAVAGDKRFHEGAVAGAEGAAAGFFGGWTIAADIAGVMLLSIRAVQSRALVYGFDPSDDEELAFALHILDASSRLGPQSKAAARTGMSKVAERMAGNVVVERGLQAALERLPAQLTTRFAAMKSESAAPIIGSVTSASFNAWYLQAVTHAARMAYRERFLRRKYGDDLLAAYGL